MKKLLLILLLFISTYTLCGDRLAFPYNSTYDWQSTYSNNKVWVGIVVSEIPNKIGNYRYDIYMTSNTYLNETIKKILVSNIKIYGYIDNSNYVESDNLTLLITQQTMLIHSLYLPSNNSKIIVDIDNIKIVE